MTNKERKKEISKQPIPTKEECLAFYKELTNLASARFVPYYKMAIKALKQESILDKVRAEIEQDMEQEKFSRSVFRGEHGEKKDAVKAEQCTGSIAAYHNVIGLIDKYKAESEGKIWQNRLK